MVRSLLASILGIASAVLILFVMGRLGFALFPSLGAFNPSEAEAANAMLSAQPVPALLWLALSWSLAATSAVFLARRVSGGDGFPALIAAAFLLLATGSLLQSGAAPLPIGLGACAAVLMGALTGWGLARPKG
ncbi:MAG: hypothetical protein AAGA36_15630 [Pseudomonadota bacterium]